MTDTDVTDTELIDTELTGSALPGTGPSPARTAPTSLAQRRLWFLDHFTGGNAAYNLVSALRLRGPLDTAALHRSLQHLVDRHEILRTTFAAEAGEPRQLIAAGLQLPCPSPT